MQHPFYRKLKKLVTRPRQYLADARLKRQLHNLAELRQGLQEAKDALAQGDTVTATRGVEALPDLLPGKWALATQLALFRSDHAEAEALALHAMQLLPPESTEFQQVFYYHQEALRFQRQYEHALELLRNKPFEDATARHFRALRLSCLGTCKLAPFEQQMLGLTPRHSSWLRARNHYLLLLRDLNQYQRAIREAGLLMEQVTFMPAGKPRHAVRRTPEQAEAWQWQAGLALGQLQEDLQRFNIDIFLVSGTLLGCIREGKILGHDSDLDVGVMPDVTMKQLRKAVDASQRFKYQEVYSENTLYLVHPNGVKIDVFCHYEEQGKLYHGGIKCRWWNTPFILKQTEFLCGQYWVPDDADRYLTENYGDWRTPVIDFETFMDTPNMETTHHATMALYFSSRAIAAYRAGDKERCQRYQSAFFSEADKA